MFTKAYNTLINESFDEEQRRIRRERILIQRSSVFLMQGDFFAAELDANEAIKLGISTYGCYILGHISEQKEQFTTAYAYYSRTSDWPHRNLIRGSQFTKEEKLEMLKHLIAANKAEKAKSENK